MTRQRSHELVFRVPLALTLLSLLFFSAGCTTLSSLGLPFGGTSNKLLDPAEEISEAPGNSLLIPKELAKQPLDTYIIEMGDTLLIEPVKFDATIRLPGDQVVKPDGYISLGEFGRLFVVDKSIEQVQLEAEAIVESHLRKDLERQYFAELKMNPKPLGTENLDNARPDNEALSDPQDDDLVELEKRIAEAIVQNEISVRLVNWDSKRIYVLGEVNSPGSFTYTGNQTVLDALIEAGGLSSRANPHQIIVSRPTSCNSCRIVMKICHDQIVQLGDASTNYQLHPGDRVFVPSLTFREDLRRTLSWHRDDHCPRCAPPHHGCVLPTGCE